MNSYFTLTSTPVAFDGTSNITYTIVDAKPSTEPIGVLHVDARKIVALELANAPYAVSAEEDGEGVRWVTIGCQKRTLARWQERGERIIASTHTSSTATERARLLKGLKVVLSAIDAAFKAK